MKPSCLILVAALAPALAWGQTASDTVPPLPPPPPAPPELSPEPLGPETSVVSPAPELTAPTQSQANPFAPPSAGNPTSDSPYRFGSVVLNPHPSYAFFHSDGILALPGEAVTTDVQSFSPGFQVLLGPIWNLDYTPTWDWYSNRVFHNTFDQNARLAGATSWQDWNLNFSQSYSRTSDPLVETALQTTEESYDTDFKAQVSTGARTSLEMELDQDIRTSPVIPNYYQWSTTDWLHYSAVPRLDTALGAGAGYVVANPGYNMDFVQPQARLRWRPADTLDVILQGGWADWSFIGSEGWQLTRPIFNASVSYLPRDGTRLTASARQDIEVGYSRDQVDQTSIYSLGLQQRLLEHFYVGAEVGEEDVAYIDIVPTLPTFRTDHATTLRFTLSTTVFRRLSLAVQYSHLRNSSDAPGYGFVSNQWGFVASYRY